MLTGLIAVTSSQASTFANLAPPPKLNPGSMYQEIQSLRALGQINRAIALGQSYLNTYPKDPDVMLLVGLMFYQKKDLVEAERYLTHVLALSPHYLDAELGLARVKIAKNQWEAASFLIAQLQQQAPADPRVQSVQIAFHQAQEQSMQTMMPEQVLSVLPMVPVVKHRPAPEAEPLLLQKIRDLREQGNLEGGSWLGRSYLKNHPTDADIMLQVGLIVLQQKKYSDAADYLHRVLKLAPNYLDAKFGLITLAMTQHHMQEAAALIKQVKQQAPHDPRVHAAQISFKKTQDQNKMNALEACYKKGDFKQAIELATQYLRQNPEDGSARLMLGRIYLSQKQYRQAINQFQILLTQDPKNKTARLALIDTEFTSGHEWQAQSLIKQALVIHPYDSDFLNQQAIFYVTRHQYPQAASLAKKILIEHPDDQSAQGLLDDITKLNPHLPYGLNEVGINSEVDYISDLKKAWQYSTLFYNHDTSWGLAALSLNNATRLGVTANQGALNLFPVISKNIYTRLTGAYANQPLLFPTYFGGIEPYFIGGPAELSLGANYSYIRQNITFIQYTASVSKEWRQYWVSFRPNYYVPAHGKKSTLYTGTLIRYFGPKDTFARLTFGSGTMPDLANLTTIDFIVIKNNFVTLNVQYPIINPSFLVTIGGDYQHWVFPNSRVRKISGMTLGFNYRFQGPSTSKSKTTGLGTI